MIYLLTNLFSSNNWVDYVIIIGFVFIALILISKFMKKSPNKILSFLGILFAGGAALGWTYKKHKYTADKLAKHNKKINDTLKRVKQKEQEIIQHKKIITGLTTKRHNMENQAKIDESEIESLQEERDKALKLHEKLQSEYEAQKAVVEDRLKKIEEMSSGVSSQVFRNKLEEMRKRNQTMTINPYTEPVQDPGKGIKTDPISKDIIIKGFRMKGDIL